MPEEVFTTTAAGLVDTCTVYGSGSAFHNLKYVKNKSRAVVFVLQHPTIADVDHVGYDKCKIRLRINSSDLEHIKRFEDQIKEKITDTKLGNMFMSSDVVANIGSSITAQQGTFATTAIKDVCDIFTQKEEQIPFEQWPRVLHKGQQLEYAIVEPFKLRYMNDSGAFTYRLRNFAVLTTNEPRQKTYSFDSD